MNPIGFEKERLTSPNAEKFFQHAVHSEKPAVPSVARIRFSSGRVLDYFNDQFDLRPGDLVFVGGKLAGQRGYVLSVSKNFKIKAADYQRVISLADTRVSGQFLNTGSHLVTFDRHALSYSQFRTWVLPPRDDDIAYYVGFDEEGFDLNNPPGWRIDPDIMGRGIGYYRDNRVLYVSLDGIYGHAIVDGTRPYEVEFYYDNGRISHLSCDCPCGYHCKHEAAALLQLQETLEAVRAEYSVEWQRSGCFAAVYAPLFFSIAAGGSSRPILTFKQPDR